MTYQTAEDLLALYDRAPLNRRYWVSFVPAVALITVLDFFDFFLIAFILAAIGPEWHLTYGQSALILYGGGVGAILGALVWGSLADVWGRKLQIVTGTFICAVSAGLIGLLPTGAWGLLALLRILVGFGLAAAVTPCPDDRRRADPDPLSHRCDQLLRGVRQRRDLVGLVHLGDPAVVARLARCCDARHRPDDRRVAGLAVRAGIGALADRQGPFRRSARRGGDGISACRATGSVADHQARRAAARRASRSSTPIRGCSGRP